MLILCIPYFYAESVCRLLVCKHDGPVECVSVMALLYCFGPSLQKCFCKLNVLAISEIEKKKKMPGALY